MDAKESMSLWLNEIGSEIDFWEKMFETNGSVGGDSRIFEYRINPKCEFQIPNDIENEHSKILDVGSGPYSRLGYIYNGKKIDMTLVDPLGYAYNKLAEKYNYTFAFTPKTGLVECLSALFEEGKFDLVHMSNALDHSFDPLEGIKQMLFVTKIGGKVVLRHHNNVAELEKYKGLHQWNITTEKGNFILWNKNERIVVNDVLKPYAIVEVAEQSEEYTLGQKWAYQKIVIRKIAGFTVENKYMANILEALLEKIMLNELYKEDGNE